MASGRTIGMDPHPHTTFFTQVDSQAAFFVSFTTFVIGGTRA